VLLALGYGFLNCPKTVQSELFYTDLRNRAAQSHHTERFLPHRKARIGSPIVIAKAQAVAVRFWPVAGLATAVIVNLVWIGFLGYGLSKLAATAFF
jgi:hypothetical protein